MSTEKQPYKDDSFWVKKAKELLKRPNISPEYRQRLEAIKADALKSFSKRGVAGGHYPRERS